MNLRFIKSTECPSCKCSVIVEEGLETSSVGRDEVRTHCNGKQWEYRKFLCGCQIKYVPNFSAEEIQYKCRKTTEYLKREEVREKLRKMSYIDYGLGTIKMCDLDKVLKKAEKIETLLKEIESFKTEGWHDNNWMIR